MKKLTFIILLLLSLMAYSQGDGEFKDLYVTNFIRLNDSTVTNIATGDTLTTNEFVRALIESQNFPSFGTYGQVPYMNVAGTDFIFSNNFRYNDTTFTLSGVGNNIFIGEGVGSQITTGISNAVIGDLSGTQISTGSLNSFFGFGSGVSHDSGSENTFIGFGSGFSNNSGSGNAFIGARSGESNLGSENTFIGARSGESNSIGDGCVFIGFLAGGQETGSNKLYVDNSSTTTPLIHGDFSADKLTFNTDSTFNKGHLIVDSSIVIADKQKITWGDGDAGFFQDGDDLLKIILNGDEKWFIQGNFIHSAVSGGAAIMNLPSSRTVPTLITNKSWSNTGMGGNQQEVSIITAGIERQRVTENSTTVKNDLIVDSTLYAVHVGEFAITNPVDVTVINTWLPAKLDTLYEDRTTNGFELNSDSTGIIVRFDGLLCVSGHATLLNNSTGNITATTAFRLVVNDTEISQFNTVKNRSYPAGGADDALSFVGTFYVNKNDTLKSEAYISNANIDLEVPVGIFDNDIPFSVSYKQISIKQQ